MGKSNFSDDFKQDAVTQITRGLYLWLDESWGSRQTAPPVVNLGLTIPAIIADRGECAGLPKCARKLAFRSDQFEGSRPEDLLHERGIDVSHATVRFWWNRFGPIFAAELRQWQQRKAHKHIQWRWHLDREDRRQKSLGASLQ